MFSSQELQRSPLQNPTGQHSSDQRLCGPQKAPEQHRKLSLPLLFVPVSAAPKLVTPNADRLVDISVFETSVPFLDQECFRRNRLANGLPVKAEINFSRH
jgi:hypothetical protein